MMSEKILACPYCGGEVVNSEWNIGSVGWLECDNCGATGPRANNIPDAILLWNAAANALAKKDEEIEKLKQWLQNSMDEEKKRQDHAIERQSKLSNELQLERKRVAAGDKRQDELEAEIARLTAACDDLQGEYLRMKDERDEARKVARRLYADNQLKDGDITRLCEEIDKVNALRPIGAPPIITYYTPHGQP